MTRRDRLVGGLAALTLAIVLEVVRGHADWGPSEGVHALTSVCCSTVATSMAISSPRSRRGVYLFGRCRLGG